MGAYLNPGSRGFEEAVNSEIFVDKTDMIRYLNQVVRTEQKYVCVSRPRRFGKSMAVKMLCAYYDREADAAPLFERCRLSKTETRPGELPWNAYLGGFDVIRLVMTDFFSNVDSIDEGLIKLQKLVIRSFAKQYPDVDYYDQEDLIQATQDLFETTHRQLVILIDEWDAILREHKEDKEGQKKYLDFLRNWLKDKEYIALAYMTGILPIKKYGRHSALNMFDEYSMLQPQQLAQSTGFTEEEVKQLCCRYQMSYPDISGWYDGYTVSDWVPVDQRKCVRQENGEHFIRIYNPLSVVKAMRSGEIENYWNETETYEALQMYIDWNFDGLKEDVAILMKGGRVRIDPAGYQNDMTSFKNKDDILTMLVHLGYLSYEREKREVFIPNREILDVFRSSTKGRDWTVTFRALQNSQKLLQATWAGDEDTVAELVEAAHDKAGNRTYNTEAALSYAIQIAYYAAQDLYTVIPELDTGKGYADLVFLPQKPDIPAMLIELKYEKDADTAIAQIHRQKYPDRLALYKGNLVMVGISYDREIRNDKVEFKHHSCVIERA